MNFIRRVSKTERNTFHGHLVALQLQLHGRIWVRSWAVELERGRFESRPDPNRLLQSCFVFLTERSEGSSLHPTVRVSFLTLRYSLYSSTGINKPDTNLQKDRFESQPCPLESERQMLDALQFAWFQRKNPLENWTVGSLSSLRDIWYAKKDDNTRAQQKHFYREH